MATTLGEVAVGNIVTLNENGVPQNYIVVQQGNPNSGFYDSSCNGTWLLRQNVYNNTIWDSEYTNNYAESDINISYLPNTILSLYDISIQISIQTVKIPYVNGTGISGSVASGSNGLSTKLFLLSGYEVGWTTNDNNGFPVDGAVLSYFQGTASKDSKRIAYLNKQPVNWWLRSPRTSNDYEVWYVRPDGIYTYDPCNISYGIRPAMILPTTLTVNDDNSIQPPTITLGELPIGSVVYLNENGTPQSYLIVNQGKPSELYDDSCDGTWLMREKVYGNTAWDSSNNNNYAESEVNKNYLPNTILASYDKNLQASIIQAKIPYVNGTGSSGSVASGSNGLSTKLFLLSGYEVGWTTGTSSQFPIDGAVLSYFQGTSSTDSKRIANSSGSSYGVFWYLRSPQLSNDFNVWTVDSSGASTTKNAKYSYYIRPTLILSSNAIIGPGNQVVGIPAPNITIPSNAMTGQSIPISWTSVDNVTNYQLQRNTGSTWETIYTGSNTSYQDTAGSWTTVQYQVAAEVNGTYGAYGQSDSIPVVSASALVISGTDEDLGTITTDIGYTVTSDTGNPISLVRKVNNIQVASLSVNSGFAYNIPIMDLPTGENSITIIASVQSTSGPVTVTRNWTYTKTPIEFPNSAGVATLVQNNKNVLPTTISEAVRTPVLWGGSLDKTLEVLSQAALYKTVTPTAQLGTLPEGSIIYLNENGSPVPFYVAKQGYESDYNTNRVLIVRKDATQQGAWNSSNINTYEDSTIDTWMNETYLNILDTNVQNEISTTSIPATSPYNSGVIRLNKSVFALSLTEFGISDSNCNVEGSALPIANLIKNINNNNQWTRSPANYANQGAAIITSAGLTNIFGVNTSTFLYRPAFTLPSTFLAQTSSSTSGLYDIFDNLILKLPGVQIETGSYVGTGTSGSSNPNSLTFEFVPKVVFIFGTGYMNPQPSVAIFPIKTWRVDGAYEQAAYITLGVSSVASSDSYAKLQDATLYWYSTNGSSSVYDQMNDNRNGVYYSYLAIG